MKKLLTATALAASLCASANAEEVKVGILLGFTGPIDSLTPAMAAGAEKALEEATAASGVTFTPVRADSTCIDAAAATAAAERLISSDKIIAIMGADCSGVTTAVLNNVVVSTGVLMISPSASSPALSQADDKGLFFRTAPSDARQGEVLAGILADRGITEMALTYTNNDYGKGLADSVIAAFEANGGKITLSAPHEDGKGDYSAEVATLAAAGGQALAVLGFVDQGGRGVVQSALDTGAFDTFVFGDGMYGENLTAEFGDAIEGSFGTVPGSDSAGAQLLADMISSGGPYTGESYDAAALIALSHIKGGDLAGNIMELANAPGEQILPGELAKAVEIIRAGGDIDYVGASDVELIGPGEAAGSYREYEVKGGVFETVRFR